MGRRALLAMFVVLLLIGTYGVYVVSYPKYPEVKGCVNPFTVAKPVTRIQENWSEVHVFFKLATMKDFWKLSKPWNVDYSHVKIVKHTIEYNGEKITMLAMGIPLEDKKHVIALYEFSKPVQGVKVRSYLLEVENTVKNSSPAIKTVALTTNGAYTVTDTCSHECNSGSDCGILARCEYYPCSTDWYCAVHCCITGGNGACTIPCAVSGAAGFPEGCIACIVAACPFCVYFCSDTGTTCVFITPGP